MKKLAALVLVLSASACVSFGQTYEPPRQTEEPAPIYRDITVETRDLYQVLQEISGAESAIDSYWEKMEKHGIEATSGEPCICRGCANFDNFRIAEYAAKVKLILDTERKHDDYNVILSVAREADPEFVARVFERLGKDKSVRVAALENLLVHLTGDGVLKASHLMDEMRHDAMMEASEQYSKNALNPKEYLEQLYDTVKP